VEQGKTQEKDEGTAESFYYDTTGWKTRENEMKKVKASTQMWEEGRSSSPKTNISVDF